MILDFFVKLVASHTCNPNSKIVHVYHLARTRTRPAPPPQNLESCVPYHRSRGRRGWTGQILRNSALHGASDVLVRIAFFCSCDPCRLFARRPARLLGLDGHLSTFFSPLWVHINYRKARFAPPRARESRTEITIYRSVRSSHLVGEVNAARTHDRLP